MNVTFLPSPKLEWMEISWSCFKIAGCQQRIIEFVLVLPSLGFFVFCLGRSFTQFFPHEMFAFASCFSCLTMLIEIQMWHVM